MRGGERIHQTLSSKETSGTQVGAPAGGAPHASSARSLATVLAGVAVLGAALTAGGYLGPRRVAGYGRIRSAVPREPAGMRSDP